jgi:integration host factor subunit beta
MTKADLVDRVAAAEQLTKRQTEAVLTQFLQGIMAALQAGDHVALRGFGRFRLRHRPARAGRNPRTGAPVAVPAKAMPWFTAAQAFHETLQARPAAAARAPGGPREHAGPHQDASREEKAT